MGTGLQTEAPYVLGHSAQELDRLSAQARLYEPFTLQLFRAAGIEPGMRVLDVGCGGGDVSLLAARLVGPTGQVLGVDQAPLAVETARRRARALRVANARFLVADTAELAAEGPFDAADATIVWVSLVGATARLPTRDREEGRPGAVS